MEREVRTQVRELWDAAEVLRAGAVPGPAAQLALHRAALEAVVSLWPCPSPEQLALLFPNTLPDGPLGPRLAALELEPARATHLRLLELLERDVRVARAWAQRRLLLAGFLLLAGLALGGLVARAVTRAREPTDLAAGHPFTYSSSWATCHPEAFECGGYPTAVFFHTNEEQSPWAQVDLGGPQDFTRVFIRNRSDLSMPRAFPLVIEVSDDAVGWREVARETKTVVEWVAALGPQRARYVRARADRFTTLHLEAFKVWR